MTKRTEKMLGTQEGNEAAGALKDALTTGASRSWMAE